MLVLRLGLSLKLMNISFDFDHGVREESKGVCKETLQKTVIRLRIFGWLSHLLLSFVAELTDHNC